jgi:hypothetical protein
MASQLQGLTWTTRETQESSLQRWFDEIKLDIRDTIENKMDELLETIERAEFTLEKCRQADTGDTEAQPNTPASTVVGLGDATTTTMTSLTGHVPATIRNEI